MKVLITFSSLFVLGLLGGIEQSRLADQETFSLDFSVQQNDNNQNNHHHYSHHRGQSGKLRSNRCSQNCQDSKRSKVCGSDGLIYKSLCELKKKACRENTHLYRQHLNNCQDLNQNKSTVAFASNSNNQESLRIIELKRRCNLEAIDQMKLLLLKHYDYNLDKMFDHFDSNRDNLIEAHELWPQSRSKFSSNLRFVKKRDETNAIDTSHESCRDSSSSKKCWLFLDIAFEPLFPLINPCSLSHLMLFDLPKHAHLFDRATFRAAFEQVMATRSQVDASTKREDTNLSLMLGDSKTIGCKSNEFDGDQDCHWTRYDMNLTLLRDPHLNIDGGNKLSLRDAQLYLSGPYKCHCESNNYERSYNIEVIAKPRVTVRPKFQESLPNSRASFECQYDFVDTRLSTSETPKRNENYASQFSAGLKINWFNERNEPLLDKSSALLAQLLQEPEVQSAANDEDDDEDQDDDDAVVQFNDNRKEMIEKYRTKVVNDGAGGGRDTQRASHQSPRCSIAVASTRLTLDDIKLSDAGLIQCKVELDISRSGGGGRDLISGGPDNGTLSVREKPLAANGQPAGAHHLWIFHDNGISIYKLTNDDGQEMELLKEINGHSLIDSEVDGNWNQLTLCGGLNQEQIVICEWSDNAITVKLDAGRKYVYVGQPNLNRLLVIDGYKFEILAIINTEPQPRKLFLYKPNRIHLGKWVRRRLSPSANLRWLNSKQAAYYPPQMSNYDARPYNIRPEFRHKRDSPNPLPDLVQFDIWLLCYGQPLIVDLNGDGDDFNNSSPFTPSLNPKQWPNLIQFNLASDKESLLRNRKSVHIIQSTFFPAQKFMKSHDQHNGLDEESPRPSSPFKSIVREFQSRTVLTTHHIYGRKRATSATSGKSFDYDLIQDLVVPSRPFALELEPLHKIHYAYVTHYNDKRLYRINMDTYSYDASGVATNSIQDDGDELSRRNLISLKNNCDPIELITTAQGLLIIQCRDLIVHNLIGQIVLDQLTSRQIEFNEKIRAQELYLSPDQRYLISIYTEEKEEEQQVWPLPFNRHSAGTLKRAPQANDTSTSSRQSIIYVQSISMQGLKLLYEIKTNSLELNQCSFVWKDGYYAAIFISTNFKDKTSEILSLRLADGRLELMARLPGLINNYHANHLHNRQNRKDQLLISDELRLATLSTNQGIFVVDLEENRVSQSLQRHQSPPTMLWV